ncbi:hypothetical protein AB840_12125 [Megasphaera cerevisiae DSM 20462]|uniref:Uncharacterized protein n=1 Tax=Megasphaera cerevisiae DSM 20462 TaxID=1122219 RepID=A0A0J6WU21_9FIRM|nr:hypothetical protein [Megasphaera cerevisiae]KMO85678.1 hypothetical protein AB840_12125 [Megasphaera cerevisiae DSM 20462]SKA11551.1 hypothetical protein SAMN05660900_02470 [Megasphaera cerevisiae DSM 20462]
MQSDKSNLIDNKGDLFVVKDGIEMPFNKDILEFKVNPHQKRKKDCFKENFHDLKAKCKMDIKIDTDTRFDFLIMMLFQLFPDIEKIYLKDYKDLTFFMHWNGGYDIKKIKKQFERKEHHDSDNIESFLLSVPYKGELIKSLQMDVFYKSLYDIHSIRIRSLWIPIYFKELEKKYGKLL